MAPKAPSRTPDRSLSSSPCAPAAPQTRLLPSGPRPPHQVHHRVLLVNTLSSPIACKQHETDRVDAMLPPGAEAAFHWQRDDRPRLLSLAFLGADADLSIADWSCAFPISDVGDLTVVCRLPRTRAKLFVSVDVQVAHTGPVP